ncbi:peroxisomal multifunctional enzyme type 2 [Anastrepha obliqua]|uniref:peroxisomal multifunctional enzyme type 2 n=1 Tax=Anastrepha obliqua TaxID=95512 RepID=UPI002409DC92|nr:peroxisomal multifunctional enzyme type 2 [Anastrepha obliqua]XP_054731454.1 peroxisomal multifunctional enzyme type 2 [Anastrepha obliqua]XP_054731455.1 peroxisomal multifunctional enzyme type 2 [Anastrepha obliqua]XP_054731456.1 peroxisomal multifunctional enzyme type 2 [Anastrepha obliqua]XP_054731457.1 peroxisomal multifunctional enzyme type 2 [Anastrepha obliqua]
MSEQLRYDGRVAVVTGAGAGLGREYALLFGSRGAKVVVNDLGGSFQGEGASKRAADVVVDEIRARGGTAVADYNSVVDGAKVIETAIKNFGRVDILVNNAGILRDRSIAKTTDQDWDLVHAVHLKGSFKCTQAAWPYMRKQNYGRIIMTSSNSGMYGNFGQANYSAAKMGLVGLANTVAIEGQKNNIHCNVIIPTAASRMTEGILPDILFNELKPHLIAPVVAYLCHESCENNGSYIESAAGWATKLQIVRGKGTVLRTSIDEKTISPEYVKSVWSKVTDMADAEPVVEIARASGYLLEVLENLKEGKLGGIEDTFKYNSKDLILYALGIGATVKNGNDLKYLYENHPEFSAIPTYFVMPALMLSLTSNLVANALPSGNAHLSNILHGEQYLEIFDDLPTSGTLTTVGKVFDVMDKGSGALVVTNSDTYDKKGRLLVKNQSSIFVLGAGKFGGKKSPIAGVVPIVPAPKRNPDSTIHYKTSEDQAALYRLSGDLNPLHIDSDFAAVAGFNTPILHGLCSLGFSIRAVLAQYASNNPVLFKAVKVRFSAPVIPGQTLRIDMWKEAKRIHFTTTVVETGKEAISGGYVDLKDTSAKL